MKHYSSHLSCKKSEAIESNRSLTDYLQKRLHIVPCSATSHILMGYYIMGPMTNLFWNDQILATNETGCLVKGQNI